jgi:hypothetical protein
VFGGFVTREEYVDSVFQIIKNNERPTFGLSAAALGQLIIKSLGVHWSEQGYQRLNLLLKELVDTKRIITSEPTKGALTVHTVKSVEPPSPGESRQLPFLRSEVWHAFVNSRPHGRRFIDRNRGILRMGLDEAPTPPDQWVEIKRVTEEMQKGWFCEFMAAKELTGDSQLRDDLGHAMWFVKVPKRLRAINPDFVKQWNWARSEQVTQHVFNWCDENTLSRSLVMRLKQPAEAPAPAPAVAEPVTVNIRENILSALTLMSTDELLSLPIPARYLLATMRR